jgi:2-succinyl-5-enolpyruvyl-6-hydroxy-3-cyclohexene-1-carboxylate synthase
LQDVPNYEALFLTPQVTTIAAIASTHKVAYTCADSVQSLRKQLACAIESRETTVLEAIVRGDLTAKMIESFMCEYLDKYEQ